MVFLPMLLNRSPRPTWSVLPKQAAIAAGISIHNIAHVHPVRKSLDARKPQIVVLLKVDVYEKDEPYQPELRTFNFEKVSDAKTCHIIGMGPAGMYAALQLLERGSKPIILERGKPARERVGDLSKIHRTLEVNPESN